MDWSTLRASFGNLGSLLFPRFHEETAAEVYRLGFWKRLRHITIPHIEPYLFGSLRNAHALAVRADRLRTFAAGLAPG